MARSCEHRDQDLLLLVHGELPWWRRAATRWHLRGCSACRERHERYVALSAHFAGPVGLPTPIGARPRLTPLLLAGVLLAALAWAIVNRNAEPQYDNEYEPALATPPGEQCGPGLSMQPPSVSLPD